MILVDTSVWVGHLRQGDAHLSTLLLDGRVLGHPAVIGEIGLGRLGGRAGVLGLLANLPMATEATHGEVMVFLETRQLFGLGIGYVDLHLLAATALTPGASLWTRDKRLRSAAATVGVLAQLN